MVAIAVETSMSAEYSKTSGCGGSATISQAAFRVDFIAFVNLCEIVVETHVIAETLGNIND